MNDPIITINPHTTLSSDGLNKYDLLQSVSPDIRQAYENIFNKVEGSLTTVSDNDTVQKIRVAIATLQPNKYQTDILLKISDAFSSIETSIDPTRLQFNITKATDDEICMNRISDKGFSTIIINEDGVVVLSFIAHKGVNESDIFEVFETNITDYEGFSYKFFAL